MRRARQEIADPAELEEIIRRAEYGVLSMVDGAVPYAVPVNPAWDGRYFYVHCALEGRKLEVLRANPRTQLCLIAEARLLHKDKPCACTMHYRSVLVDGRAEILLPGADENARRAGLECLLAGFAMQNLPMDQGIMDKTVILRITPEKIRGKRNPA
ncbi:MAG: pyridoxamine 5'-phosphate oxidase family protein [Desulfovibrionaceae bacterium]|nr:pyridoxamine 5'-phosphate oxidase family protein [Desulfovibrionaceae bacterium]